MQPSPAIHAELERCGALLSLLRASSSVEEAEDLWKQFLSHLERVWYKCEAHFKRSPKWNGWKGQYERARKKDPLLLYLINARGADEHTVTDIVAREPAKYQIGPVPGHGRIRYLAIPGDHYEYDADGPFEVSFVPARLVLLPVTNRGRTYRPPKEHLGRSIAEENVISIAEAGLSFYKSVVGETERFIVKQ